MTLLQLSGMGTLLILLVLLLRRLVGNRLPPVCYLLLWLLAGLRLLLPVRIASPCSVYNLFSLKQQPTAWIGQRPETVQVLVEPAHRAADVVVHTGSLPVAGPVLLWLLGMAVCMTVVMVSHWRCRRWYACSLPADEPNIRQWQASHRLWRNYQIRRSQLTQVPFTYGFWKPVIVLPARQQLAEEQLEMILLHEWNHIRHGDVLWQWLLLLVCSIHWFNPAVWLMYRLCRQDLELFCDEATVKRLDGAPQSAYALLLLQQAAGRSGQGPLFSSFCFTEYRKMKERVQLIMQTKQEQTKIYRWKITVIVLCFWILGGLCFATSATAAESNGQLAQALQDSITVQADCVQFQIPKGYRADNGWSILVAGRREADGIGGISQHFFETESQQNSWQPGKTYTIETAGKQYTELWLTVGYPAAADNNGAITETWNLLWAKAPSEPVGSAGTQLQWPVACDSLVVTSAFGERVHPITKAVLENDHICIGGDGIQGAAVLAAASGTVLETGYTPAYGNYLIIGHHGDLTTVTHYRHCDAVTVQQGQQVTAGQQIGTVGQTGTATGPCLAFALYQQGKACDPLRYLPEKPLAVNP